MDIIVEKKSGFKRRLIRCIDEFQFRVLPKMFLFLLHIFGFMPCSANKIYEAILIGANIFQQILSMCVVGYAINFYWHYHSKSMWFFTLMGACASKIFL